MLKKSAGDQLQKTSTPREIKKKELRKAIFETAIKLFLKKGFEKVKVEDITSQLNIAKGTFFNYFPNKESLLLNFMRRHLEEVREVLLNNLLQYRTAEKQLHYLFSMLSKMVVENEPLVKWCLLESLRLRVYKKEKKAVSRKILEILTEIIREGQIQGELRKGMNPEKIAKIFESIFFFSAIRWLTFDRNIPLFEDVKEQITYCLKGIRAS